MNDRKRMLKPAALGILWAASLAAAYYSGGGNRMASDSVRDGDFAAEQIGEPSRSGRAGSASTPILQQTTSGSGTAVSGAATVSQDSQPFDPQAEFDAIMTRPPGPLRNEALEDLFSRWAEADGPAAIEKTLAVDEPLLRYQLKEAVLRHWAMKNPEEAFRFALANKNNDLPEGRIDLVLNGMARGDIQTALDFFQKHSSGDLKPYLEGAVYAFDRLYQRGGHDMMVPWAESLPAGKMKDGAVNRIIDQWARYDPLKAKEWTEKMLLTNKENTVPARIELAESWARVNPLQALNWINSLPAADRQTSYFEAVYRRWLQYDQNNAAAYLANQPPSPALDRPIETYTNQVMNQNPSASMPWAESITDPNRRWRAIERVATVWRRRDPNGLASYVARSNFSPDQQRTLLRLDEKK